jgi:hypothetical protein
MQGGFESTFNTPIAAIFYSKDHERACIESVITMSVNSDYVGKLLILEPSKKPVMVKFIR